jgi:uncharacterized protein (DUF924 family)
MQSLKYHEVLDFWFSPENENKWFNGGYEFDSVIKAKFKNSLALAAAGEYDGWKVSPEGRLALIIILDQFSRNLMRGQTQAFATDYKAIEIVKEGLSQGVDLWLKANKDESWRAFFYMPLMHSEELADQLRCVELFETYGPEKNILFAKRHYDIIKRFGRFPHRNKILNRASAKDEEIFLMQEGSKF